MEGYTQTLFADLSDPRLKFFEVDHIVWEIRQVDQNKTVSVLDFFQKVGGKIACFVCVCFIGVWLDQLSDDVFKRLEERGKFKFVSFEDVILSLMILIALGLMVCFDFGSDSVSDSELVDSHEIRCGK